SAPTLARKLPPDSSLLSLDPPPLRLFEWGVGVLALATVVCLATYDSSLTASQAPSLIAWLAIVVAVDLISVRYSHHLMTMSVAILLAAGMVLSVAEVGVIALIGSIDMREIKREVGLARSLFNRG